MAQVDLAIVAALRADSTLAGLAGGDVWRDVAPLAVAAGPAPFVIVSLMENAVEPQFNGIAWEESHHLAKAVGKNLAAVEAAAARIEVLLEGATITVGGVPALVCRRYQRVYYTEVDGENRWFHAGGVYQVRTAS